jgi:hypothetical protein
MQLTSPLLPLSIGNHLQYLRSFPSLFRLLLLRLVISLHPTIAVALADPTPEPYCGRASQWRAGPRSGGASRPPSSRAKRGSSSPASTSRRAPPAPSLLMNPTALLFALGRVPGFTVSWVSDVYFCCPP